MIKEIGSEFWDVPTIDIESRLFPKYTQWFLSGRSALKAIIRELPDCNSIAMPSWCCDSMIKPFVDAGFEIHLYPVYFDCGLVQEIRLDCDALLLMDYFGYTTVIPKVKGYKGTVIRDVTHSLFSYTYSDADYYFGSLRKWCGVWTGGYAWTRDGHRVFMENSGDSGYVHFREEAMNLKNSYINGWGVTEKGYIDIFDNAEECLENVGIAPAAERDVMLAQKLDIEKIRRQRRANAEVLRNALPNWLIFPELKDTDCPMFVPVIVSGGKRNKLREYLIKNEIYCPVHWPVSKYHKLNERTDFIYKNELSLVCDQRYTEEDMLRMVKTIGTFMEG